MASVFRRSYWVETDGKRIKRKCRVYTVRYRDGGGKLVTVTGYTDKEASRQLGARLEREIARGAEGLVDPFAETKRRLLGEHVRDYIQDLQTLGRRETYTGKIEKRLPLLFDGCGWRTLADLQADPARFTRWRAAQKASGAAGRTLNHYLEALRSFLSWCKRQNRIGCNPAMDIEKIDLTSAPRKRIRRALSMEELEALFTAAPEDRRLIYRTVFYCGLRRQDVLALRWCDVELDTLTPYLLTRAETSKGKRETRHALRCELAEELKRLRPEHAAATDRVFPRVPKMGVFKADLKAAKIPELDEFNRVVDFHALGRNTPNTVMANANVPLQLRMDFMRHTEARLTTGTYTDARLLDKLQAVETLPWIEAKTEANSASKATA